MMEVHRFNIRHLAALAAVVRSGSISAAARVVNLTQPAVTQGIAKLEAQLGFLLFDRTPTGIVPREEARILAGRVEAALRLMGTRNATAAQVRAFIALARAGSYAGAAAMTRLAEASLHRAVADLSLVIGARLVDRRGRGIALTRRGETLARDFRLALGELRSGLSEVHALQGQETGRIAIGAMPLARARILPDSVAAFHSRHPDVRIAISEGSHLDLVGPLRDGEIDMMIGAVRNLPRGGDLIETPLFDDRPIIVGRMGHPLSQLRGKVPIAQLTAYPWIVAPEGTPLRQLWRGMFATAGVEPPRVPIECGAVITIRQLIRDSDFLTLLSPDQLAIELEAGLLAHIADAPDEVRRTIGITTRADWRPTPRQASFLATIEEQARQKRGGEFS